MCILETCTVHMWGHCQLGCPHRSGHGGCNATAGDDDTCSLPTTTWSGQQARTPIAVRRLGPLPAAPAPHDGPRHADRGPWLGRMLKLAALGAVVIISAAGFVKARHANNDASPNAVLHDDFLGLHCASFCSNNSTHSGKLSCTQASDYNSMVQHNQSCTAQICSNRLHAFSLATHGQWCACHDGASADNFPGFVQAVDWHNAPAQKVKRAARLAEKKLHREEAEHAAWLQAQARQAAAAQQAERQALLQQERCAACLCRCSNFHACFFASSTMRNGMSTRL